MIRTYNSLPTYNEPFAKGGATSKSWYAALQGLWKGTPPGAETPITPTGSPFVYTAPSAGFVIVNGGTVSAVQFNRSGGNHITGQTQGLFPVSAQDILSITYTSAPTLTFVPQ